MTVSKPGVRGGLLYGRELSVVTPRAALRRRFIYLKLCRSKRRKLRSMPAGGAARMPGMPAARGGSPQGGDKWDNSWDEEEDGACAPACSPAPGCGIAMLVPV